MTDTIKISLRISLAILLGFSLVVPQAYANHSWGKYHWDLSTVATIANPLNLGDNLTNGWSTNLSTASVDWNASKYTSGVYFYRLQTDRYTETKKMLIIK